MREGCSWPAGYGGSLGPWSAARLPRESETSGVVGATVSSAGGSGWACVCPSAACGHQSGDGWVCGRRSGDDWACGRQSGGGWACGCWSGDRNGDLSRGGSNRQNLVAVRTLSEGS